ncbi:zinc finger protein 345-like isoform X3 [Symsagittifera roscoffensis]|uniref:zinc finger protein 345-like isoform X3 n=1 Tax=Symsagittifera roscoffensis TaxID=84072 RepID=UPI00307C7A9D
MSNIELSQGSADERQCKQLAFHVDSEIVDLDIIAPTFASLTFENDSTYTVLENQFAQADGVLHNPLSTSVSCTREEICDVIEEVICSSDDVQLFPHHFTESKAVCEICGKTLDSIPPEYSSNGQHKPSGVICEPCAKDAFGSSIYSSDYNTNSEKWELSQEEEHRCDICGEVFLNQQSLNIHRLPSNSSIHCKTCLVHFATETHLKEHEKVHECEKPFACRICNESFATTSELTVHAAKHEQYQCKICNMMFPSSAQCTDHVNRVHMMGLSVDDVFFSNPNSKQQRGKKWSNRTCNLCNRTFTTAASFQVHVKLHENETSFTCPVCLRQFKLENYLKRHMLMHARSREFNCHYCGKQFRLKSNLDEHVRIHTGERPYRCDYCNLTFTQNSTLRRHLVIHTGQRVHECGVCGKAFARPNQLTIHERIHSGEKPFECKVCRVTFNQSSQLNRHTKKLHPAQLESYKELHEDPLSNALSMQDEIPKWDIYMPRISLGLDSPSPSPMGTDKFL